MLQRKLTNTSICPQCGSGSENMDHLFRACPGSFRKVRYLSVDFFAVYYGPFGETGTLECIRRLANLNKL